MFRPSSISFEGGLDLITPPVSRRRRSGTCVLLRNYVATERGYSLVEGYTKFRTQAVPGATGAPILAIAQGAFTHEGGPGAIGLEAHLGRLSVEGQFEVQVATEFSTEQGTDEPLVEYSTEAHGYSTASGEAATPATPAVDIYAFRRQTDGTLGVFKASVGTDGAWVSVPIDGDLSPAPDAPTLTEKLAPPAFGERVRWLSRSFSSNAESRMFFVTGQGPERGLYEIVNINGVSAIRGHEIGTERLPALTEAEQKYPCFIQAHQNHLFLGYKGGSVIWSALGDPDNFSAIIGAGEVNFPNIGTRLTGILPGFDRRLWIFGSDSIHYLEGSSARTFAVRTLTEEIGAAADTLQLGTTPLFFSNAGLYQIASGEGIDFSTMLLTRALRPYIQALTEKSVRTTDSVLLHDKNQYRIYLDDKTAIVGALVERGQSGLVWEFSTLHYPKTVSVASSTSAPRDITGQYLADRSLIALGREDRHGAAISGDEPDGIVYLDGRPPDGDAPPSTFDGASIHGAMQLGLQFLGSPAVLKKFNRMTIHGTADEDFEIGVGFGFGSQVSGTIRRDQPVAHMLSLPRRNTDWADRFSDDLPEFDADEWSAINEDPWSEQVGDDNDSQNFDCPGTGVGCDVYLTTKTSDSDAVPPPHQLTGVSIYWKQMRDMKG